MKDFIPVNEPLLKGNEKKYILQCIDSNWISSEGNFVQSFEKKFAKRIGKKYGIAVTNGTSAIDVAVESLGIGSGDEVILPTFTIISCILQIVRSGATPVLVDADPSTWSMNVDQVESKITNRTKAIMAVHIYGLPVDMDPLIKLCKKYKIKLIEDAAEMIGQKYKGKNCGSFGDISTFSFYSNKHITTGEGGMVLTNNKILAEKILSLRNLCFQKKKRFVHNSLGWNLRMTNLQASIGVAQLEQLDKFVKKKRWIGSYYNKLFSDMNEIVLPLKKTNYASNIYWVYGLLLKKSSNLNVKKLIDKLSKNGIGSRPFFCPLHMQPVLKKFFPRKNNYPVAERLYKYGLYLPSGLNLNEKKIKKVSKIFRKIIKK